MFLQKNYSDGDDRFSKLTASLHQVQHHDRDFYPEDFDYDDLVTVKNGALGMRCVMKMGKTLNKTLREKCRYSGLFWSAFSRIWTDYGEILRMSPYSIRMRENEDQNNSEYGHFLRSEICENKTVDEQEDEGDIDN